MAQRRPALQPREPPGGDDAKLEEFFHDRLGRLDGALTRLGGSKFVTRKLSFGYDARGNLKSKTSSVDADINVSHAYTDRARPNRLTDATIGGEAHEIRRDANGNVDRYRCTTASGCGHDRSIEWNGRNLPERITLGAGKSPAARDEFSYGRGPAHARPHASLGEPTATPCPRTRARAATRATSTWSERDSFTAGDASTTRPWAGS